MSIASESGAQRCDATEKSSVVASQERSIIEFMALCLVF